MSNENINEELPKRYYIIHDIECPNCNNTFRAPAIRKPRLRLKEIHENLKPEYVDTEPALYEVVFCPHCGYTRLANEFEKISEYKKELFKQEIGNKFNKRDNDVVITLDQAIERYKFALITAKAMSLSSTEVALIFYKLSWMRQLRDDEYGYINSVKKSYDWFEKAIIEDRSAFQLIDEDTTNYLMSVFAKDFGDYTASLKHCGNVLLSPTSSEKLKSRARDLKIDIVKLKEKYPMGRDPFESQYFGGVGGHDFTGGI